MKKCNAIIELESKLEVLKEEVTAKNENYDKSIAFYTQGLGGWLSTALEKDKTLIALSAAELGATISYFSSSTKVNIAGYILLILSSVALMITIYFALLSFDLNKKYLMESIRNNDPKDIGWVDRISHYSFIIGTLITIVNFLLIITTKLPKGV
jgi:hypothetical protein